MKQYTFNSDREEKNKKEKKIYVRSSFDFIKIHATAASSEMEGGVAAIGWFYRSALPLGGWSYIMETYNFPVEEVSSLMSPS